jgi:uncharacterized Zn finger protein
LAYYSDYGYPKYVTAAERKRKAQLSVEKLRKKNPQIAPNVITGRKIAATWWGKSWNDNLESYADFANRIARGRSYVRNGAVLDLRIAQGKIEALVQGSTSKPYQVKVEIQPLAKSVWDAIAAECAGKMDSLQELLEGKFPKGLSALFTAKGKGLFPAPKEINFHCSCPDSAYMCKHVAAVLYGIGARLDGDTSLFFTLREVNVTDLISATITAKSRSLLNKSETRGRRVIRDADLAGTFGIELETAAGTETGSGSMPKAGSRPGTETNPKTKPKMKPKTKPKTKSEPGSRSGSEPKSGSVKSRVGGSKAGKNDAATGESDVTTRKAKGAAEAGGGRGNGEHLGNGGNQSYG